MGLYVTYLMEEFEGDVKMTPLKTMEDRRLYRAVIASRLILSDANITRAQVLEKVKKFTEQKEDVATGLYAERALIVAIRLKGSLKFDATKEKKMVVLNM